MPARKYQPSRVMTQMANSTKKYPKFFQPHEVKAIDESAWETVTEQDADVVLVSDASGGRSVPRAEEKSEVRLLSSLTPLSNSVFEELLAPPADTTRTSARPTVPLGPSAVMVVSDEDMAAQQLATQHLSAQISGALLARPPAQRAYGPRPSTPLLAAPRPLSALPLAAPSAVAARKRGRIAPVAALAAFFAAGVAIFGGVHFAKSAHLQLESPLSAVRAKPAEPAPAGASAAEREAEHPERARVSPLPLETAAAHVSPTASPSDDPRTGAKKPPIMGPSRAKAALAAGDLETASNIFEELAENPATKMDGLAGLAEVSRARGDFAGAQARYRDILLQSPMYFPAKLGLADTTWDLGDKAAARKQYRALETSYPTRMLPARAIDRAR